MTDPCQSPLQRLRLDRSVTLWLNRLRRFQADRADWLPVLMFHSVSAGRERLRHPYFSTTISPGEFEARLRMLRENGYDSVTLDQLVNGAWNRIRSRGRKPVLITFDDGFVDFFTTAAPLLVKWGYSAVMFLPTDLLDGRGRPFKSRPCMNWNQVRTLAEAGFEFGSHTASHTVLTGLTGSQIEHELVYSKARIEDQIGREVIAFAYPYAFPQADERFLGELETLLTAAGYRLGFTTVIGGLTQGVHPLFIPRLPINDFDDPALFAAKLNGAYNWLSWLQRSHKRIQRRLHRRNSLRQGK